MTPLRHPMAMVRQLRMWCTCLVVVHKLTLLEYVWCSDDTHTHKHTNTNTHTHDTLEQRSQRIINISLSGTDLGFKFPRREETISATDPRVVPLGRHYFPSAGGIGFSWLGAGVTVYTAGQTYVRATFAPSNASFKVASYTHDNSASYFPYQAVSIIPGTGISETITASAHPGSGTSILLNTPPQFFEREDGAAQLVSLSTDGTFIKPALPPKGKKRILHFLGDSITAATNVHGGVHFCKDAGLQSDYSASWAGILCESFEASCSTIAVGGACLVESCPSVSMPRYYALERYNDSDENPFNFSTDEVPDGVVVYLGTNDWGKTANPSRIEEEFTSQFLEFANNVTRLWYGTPSSPANVTFFAVLGPMRPSDPAHALQDIVQNGTKAGLSIKLVNITSACGRGNYPNCDDGCAGHPGVASHRNMAYSSAPSIGATLGWAVDRHIAGNTPCVLDTPSIAEDHFQVGSKVCIGTADCSFAGRCLDGRCHCEKAWTGPRCESLALLPAKRDGGFDANVAYGYCQDSWNCNASAGVWGAGIIRGPDNLYHLFVNVISGGCPWLVETVTPGVPHENYYPVLLGTNSHIVHATASDPQGPFKHRDVAVMNVANNPLITQSSSGKGPYYLWFEGRPLAQLNRSAPVCNGTKVCKANCDHHSYSDLNPGPMSVAVSDSLNGPWKIHPLGLSTSRPHAWDAGADLTNPAVYIFPNGTTLLAYRTEGGKQSWQLGIAVGPSPTGPFKQPNVTAFPQHAEDPVIWRDTNGVFQMLVHNCSGVGPPPTGKGFFHCLHQSGSAWSLDGLNWTVRGNEPFSYNVPYADGSTVACDRREEPKLLFDYAGQPTHLVTVCAFSNFTSRIIIQPIGTSQYSEISN